MKLRVELGDSVFNSYNRDDPTLIYKEDVMNMINSRMNLVIDNAECDLDKRELKLLKAFLLATIADM